MSKRSSRNPNDDKSDSLNPNNPAYQESLDNSANQQNPNNPTYYSSRGIEEEEEEEK